MSHEDVAKNDFNDATVTVGPIRKLKLCLGMIFDRKSPITMMSLDF